LLFWAAGVYTGSGGNRRYVLVGASPLFCCSEDLGKSAPGGAWIWNASVMQPSEQPGPRV
jgi:hypothetical protein